MSELQLSKTSKKILIDINKNSKIKNSNDFAVKKSKNFSQ